MLLSFSPFIAYAVLSGFTSLAMALWAAAAVAAALLLRERFVRHRALKILDIGTVLLFAGLAFHVGATGAHWRVPEVRLAVDGGLLAIALASMLLRQPFTLQYAREQVPREVQQSPRFVAVNWHITAVWTLAFALIVGCDFMMARRPQAPIAPLLLLSAAALASAIAFTAWYPNWLRRRALQANAPGTAQPRAQGQAASVESAAEGAKRRSNDR